MSNAFSTSIKVKYMGDLHSTITIHKYVKNWSLCVRGTKRSNVANIIFTVVNIEYEIRILDKLTYILEGVDRYGPSPKDIWDLR